MNDKVVYLDNTFIDGGNKIKEFTRLKKRVQNRLGEWLSRQLSKARKTMLIKSVIQVIPLYPMFTF